MKNIDLSIIVPIYNCEKYIAECIESIILEKNVKFELILINDGSKDNSGEICDFYQKKDKRIKVIHQKNSGVSEARNNGIKNANSKYIMFVDADDTMSNDWGLKIKSVLKENYDIVFFQNKFQSTNLDKTNIILNILKIDKFDGWSFSNPWSKIFKTEFIKENNILFDKKIINGEDMLFNIEAITKAKKINISDRNIYFYRISDGQVTKNFNEKLIESDLNFHKKLKKLLGDTVIGKDKINTILEKCKKNGIYMILKRMCSFKNYNYVKNNIDFVNNKEYDSISLEKSKKDSIISMARKQQILLIYIYFNIIKFIKKIKISKTYKIEV